MTVCINKRERSQDRTGVRGECEKVILSTRFLQLPFIFLSRCSGSCDGLLAFKHPLKCEVPTQNPSGLTESLNTWKHGIYICRLECARG